jgi:pyrroline-5-carboxylate reductase
MAEFHDHKTLGFLGAGKMARALAAGLVRSHAPFLGGIWASARTEMTLTRFGEAVGIGRFRPAADNRELVAVSDVVILGIKPAQAQEVLEPLKSAARGKLFISLLAGVPTARIERFLGPGARVVRAMPNTPALIGEGITGFAGGVSANVEDLRLAEAILASVGTAVKVAEKDLDAVTAVSGSGPAYVYHFLNALIEGGVAEGLSPEVARTLAVQTVLGAAKMVEQSADSPISLANQVKSPNGTTVAGCNVLAERGWEAALKEAVAAARRRAGELSAG